VEGLAHCGGCHTPRNRFGAEIADKRYAGADVDGWDAYAIDADSTAPVPWNVEDLTQYLKHGFAENHGVAAGAMASVVGNLQDVPDADIRAIATYVASQIGSPSSQSLARGAALVAQTATTGNGLAPASAGLQIAPPALPDESGVGAAVYAAVCSTCHESRRPLPYGGIDLRLSSALSASSPRNAINLIMFGIPAADGVPASMMPGFAGSFTDAQISDLVTYLRSRFGNGPAWSNVPELVEATRERSAMGDAPHTSDPRATKRLTSGDSAS
jgi:mono/diheme cytochrome c family protein